jgi:hypothetical protein
MSNYYPSMSGTDRTLSYSSVDNRVSISLSLHNFISD